MKGNVNSMNDSRQNSIHEVFATRSGVETEIKVASFQLRYIGWWEVRFLDEEGNSIKTNTYSIFSDSVITTDHGREWVGINWPITKWGAKRIVKRFLSGRTREIQKQRLERQANHTPKIYTYGG